jgi:succinate dehydrogenase/fumarate reductase-like Fe-S protein
VNHGGLYVVEDVVYDLFVSIDAVIDSKLNLILKECGKGIDQVKKEKLAWVCADKDVLSVWNQIDLSPIEDELIIRDLFYEIVHMWVTTRGHSKVHKLKADYKQLQKRSIKKINQKRTRISMIIICIIIYKYHYKILLLTYYFIK